MLKIFLNITARQHSLEAEYSCCLFVQIKKNRFVQILRVESVIKNTKIIIDYIKVIVQEIFITFIDYQIMK